MYNPVQMEAFLLQRFGTVRRGHGKKGLELITKCPVCGKRKLSVNTNTGLYQCWRGCVSGHVDKLLGNIRAMKLTTFAPKPVSVARDVDSPGELIPLTTLDDDHQASVYLQQRGFNVRILEDHYGFRYCRQGKKYANGLFDTTNTIIIPVYKGGTLIGWQSRLLYNPDGLDDRACEGLGFIKDEDGDWVKPPKYFTMPGLDKGKILWNYDWARQSNIVVVCEGVFDAVAVGRCAVACFGKGLTDNQVNMLKEYWDLVVLLLDPGDADKQMALLDQSSLMNNALPVHLEGYKDAGEAPQAEIWRQIDQAIAEHPILAANNRTLDTYRFVV
jgi:hypothetical protein